jgi:hypothetical protein
MRSLKRAVLVGIWTTKPLTDMLSTQNSPEQEFKGGNS